jgi:hypothetical protein
MPVVDVQLWQRKFGQHNEGDWVYSNKFFQFGLIGSVVLVLVVYNLMSAVSQMLLI